VNLPEETARIVKDTVRSRRTRRQLRRFVGRCGL